ncbi:MAG: galactose-1-phosphate uridylyltransferase [Candidatus Firestonebacteria bacterium GWA2_43_8]|nr:MAG: galactose-1-phosphate uridylyltransferase [Candidatus Firestonebacteria bacterium GWA2_43_8]
MPELRKDPVSNRWVIISTDRSKRPTDFVDTFKHEKKGGFCPFCYGNEDKTPGEIIAIRPSHTGRNTSGWQVRVVPNKFPVLRVEGDLNRRGDGMYDMMEGIGAHEVIIETPEHDKSMADFSYDQVQKVIWTYKMRSQDLKNDLRFEYLLIFRNYGDAAGATLEHPHSQLIATPIVPKRVLEEYAGAKHHYEYKERCVFCDMIKQEMKDGTRVIMENKHFIAFAPFAPRFPFETWILPKSHNSDFMTISEEQSYDMAKILKDVLMKIKGALNDPPYNYIIHTAPLRKTEGYFSHWHMEIIPKLTKVAGFEWGSGFYINPTPPEEAAKYLKDVEI